MINDKVLTNIINQLVSAIQEIAIFESMLEKYYDIFNYDCSKIIDPTVDKVKETFVSLMNNVLLMGFMRLATVIGTDSENNHWKKLNLDSTQQTKIRNDVFIKILGSKKEWNSYHQNLVDFRNQYITHHASWEETVVPYLQPTKQIIIDLYNFLCDISNMVSFSIELLYENQIEDTKKLFSKINLDS